MNVVLYYGWLCDDSCITLLMVTSKVLADIFVVKIIAWQKFMGNIMWAVVSIDHLGLLWQPKGMLAIKIWHHRNWKKTGCKFKVLVWVFKSNISRSTEWQNLQLLSEKKPPPGQKTCSNWRKCAKTLLTIVISPVFRQMETLNI